MEKENSLKNLQIFALGLCIAVGTVASSFIIARTMVSMKKFSTELISVTGSAEKKIVSDYITWKLSFSRRAPALTDTYKMVQQDLKVVKDYLITKHVNVDDILVSPVSTEVIYKKNDKGNNTNDIEAYRLTQSVTVRSTEVDKVNALSRESTELIDLGIELISDAPEYFYTKLADLKVEMLREATKDAKRRAAEIASSAGNRVGAVRSARMGVFQITPVNSVEVSDWGVNDTSSLEKKVTAVVRADFAIDA